jgi:hypothetical protein
LKSGIATNDGAPFLATLCFEGLCEERARREKEKCCNERNVASHGSPDKLNREDLTSFFVLVMNYFLLFGVDHLALDEEFSDCLAVLNCCVHSHLLSDLPFEREVVEQAAI